jgi:hypothetical protein
VKSLRILKIVAIVVSIIGLLWAAIIPLPIISQEKISPLVMKMTQKGANGNSEESLDLKSKLEAKIAQQKKKLNSYKPKGNYLIVNSTDNQFKLCKDDKIIREGKCSTGSYLKLEAESRKKSYLFKTPKGELTVKGKKTNPVWTKPDWAFIEEGLPVPGPNHPSRFEENVLGDYALVLGDGYMIHGTIWQRYLGLSVTHGCIRLNDADLEAIYKALDKGSKVYIY